MEAVSQGGIGSLRRTVGSFRENSGMKLSDIDYIRDFGHLRLGMWRFGSKKLSAVIDVEDVYLSDWTENMAMALISPRSTNCWCSP